MCMNGLGSSFNVFSVVVSYILLKTFCDRALNPLLCSPIQPDVLIHDYCEFVSGSNPLQACSVLLCSGCKGKLVLRLRRSKIQNEK